MKEMKIWSVMLLTLIFAGFTSCSSDDDDDSNHGKGTAIGDAWVTIAGDEVNATTYKTVDAQGRIVQLVTIGTEKEEGNEVAYCTKVTYTYESDKIKENWYFGLEVSQLFHSITKVYTLNSDGLIERCVETESYEEGGYSFSSTYVYTYNDKKQVTSLTTYFGNNTYGDTQDFQWDEAGNLIKEAFETHKYSNLPDVAGWNGPMFYVNYDEGGFLYSQGYFGTKSKNLVSQYNNQPVHYEMSGSKVTKITCSDGVYTLVQ